MPERRSRRTGRASPRPESQVTRAATLVAMFNQIRDELVSTLLYLLGNADDAQDAAEAFLKCWQARASVPTFKPPRVDLSRRAERRQDFQRSAWNRKSRPLPRRTT